MDQLFGFFVRNWRFSAVLTLMTLLAGVLGSGLLRREAFPPVNFAQVLVLTIYPGASPEEVQDKITKPIEDEIRGISGIKDVRSTSQNERSEINIRIDIDGANSDQVVTEIQRGVQRAASKLPAGIPDAPLVTELKADEIPVLEVAILGPNQNRQRDLLAEDLKEILEDNAGVASVRFSGHRRRELQILLDPERLRRTQVGIAEVTQAVSSRLKDVPAGFLRTDSTLKLVRVVGKITDAETLGNVVVRANEAQSVRVRDVARIVDASEPASVLARANGVEATLLITTKKAQADGLTMIGDLRSRVREFEKKLPETHRLVIYNDEGRRIQTRLEIVSFNAFAGLAVVLLVLFMFLPGKIGVASAMSLPLCTLATLTLMVAIGANFNIITMMALIICLGNLVDNSIVISEHYTRLREEGLDGREAAIRSARQFWVPFTASTVTIIAAFLPMLVTKGVMGQFIRWIPIVVTIALMMSLVEALTLLPARLQFLNPKPKSIDAKPDRFKRIEAAWGKFIAVTLRRKYLTLATLIAVVISGFLVTAVFNRFELFPSEGDEYYLIRYDLKRDAPIEATDRIGAWISEQVTDKLGTDTVLAVINRAGAQQVDGGDPLSKTGEHVGLTIIAVRPEVAPSLSIPKTLETLRKIPKHPELEKFSVETLPAGPPVGKPLTVTFRSSNYPELKTMASEMLEAVKAVPGVLAPELDEQNQGDEYRFEPSDNTIASAGLGLETLGLNLRTALEGFVVTELTENRRDFEVLIRFDDQSRTHVDDLNSAKVLNNQNNIVALGALGRFKESQSPVIQRNFQFKRSITLTSEVDVAKITSSELNVFARKKFAELQSKYPSVSLSFGGEEESTNESLASLGVALILAVLGIFATLVFTFGSFSSPLLVLSTIPLGLVGVFYAFVFDQRPLSFLAFIGVVGLTGVVINSAIILVDYIQELLKKAGPNADFDSILVKASTDRLRAVLATGLTTVVGLVPTAFGLGGYDPILVPMTLALQWGMIVGTVLSLIWIPSGYSVLFGLRRKLMHRLGRA
jgi:multidrug efflux pump subunit AcrB